MSIDLASFKYLSGYFLLYIKTIKTKPFLLLPLDADIDEDHDLLTQAGNVKSHTWPKAVCAENRELGLILRIKYFPAFRVKLQFLIGWL